MGDRWVLWLAMALIAGCISWEAFKWRDCRGVGHSWFYCVTGVLS